MIYIAIVAIIGFAWFSFRYAWWARPVDYRQPRILMYHMIRNAIPGGKFNRLRVSPEFFEWQLQWFKKNNWQFVTMRELVENRHHLAPKTVALTFDDGFADNYTHAFPLMKKYGAKGTLYLVVDRHNRDWSIQRKAQHDSGELMREPKLSDEQVKEMVDSGIFELGGHTLTHTNLATITRSEKRREIAEAKTLLEKTFNTSVTSFAYPFGIYTKEDLKLVEEAGFTNAVTTEASIDFSWGSNLMKLKRVKMSGKDNFLAFKLRMKHGKRGWKK